MKNTVYAIVIAVCILGAIVVFVSRRGRSGAGIDSIADSKMTWVKCAKCGQGYEMSEKQYYKELEEQARANPSPIPVAMPLKCQKCGQDKAVRKAFKCEKCGEISFLNSVPADYEDRCPKCKHSAIESSRKARLGQQ
jgi:DNA-directed RNA polymerase subunit RPC12/RpoP